MGRRWRLCELLRARGDRDLRFREKSGRIVFFEFKQKGLTRREVQAIYESLSGEAGQKKRDDDYAKEKNAVDRQVVWVENAEDDRGVETMATLQYDPLYSGGRVFISRGIVGR